MRTVRSIINEVSWRSKVDIPQINKKLKPLLSLLKSALKEQSVSAVITPGGSLAKGTILSDDFDIDLFVVFSKVYANSKKSISDILESCIKLLKKEGFDYTRVHGSRDYFQIQLDQTVVEVVPVLKHDLRSTMPPQNVTDMSPLHVKWVQTHIPNADHKLAGDIRAAKLFCKHHRIYGAESYIKGLSGHVLDILTIQFKGFDKLLETASKWTKVPIVVDPQNHYKGKAAILMNQSKLGPLIVVDPVDKSRNAAAAVNKAALKKFVSASKRFLKKPSLDFFTPYKFDLNAIMKERGSKNKHFTVILPKLPISKAKKSDVVGAKLLKQFEHLFNYLTDLGFEVVGDWYWDKSNFAVFWIKYTDDLPLYRIHFGPLVNEPSQEKHVASFKKKYHNAKTQGDRLMAKVKNDFRKVEDAVKSFFSKDAEIFVRRNK